MSSEKIINSDENTEVKKKTLHDILTDLGIKKEDIYVLLIWNDDVNDMIDVTIALMEVCKLDAQASFNVMMQAHKNGKAVAKRDGYQILEVMKQGLNDRKIEATIEKE